MTLDPSFILLYQLEQRPDGLYVARNRHRTQLRTDNTGWIEADDLQGFDIEITPGLASSLSYCGDCSADGIYLYNDVSQPWDSYAKLNAYARKVERLEELGCTELNKLIRLAPHNRPDWSPPCTA